MSRLHTGTVTRPRFESAPYRQSPGRREFVYGKIIPANDSHTIGPIGVLVMVVCAGLIGFMMVAL